MLLRHSVPQEVLGHVREKARVSQAAIATAMGTVPSVLSKLQRADEVEAEVAARYLSAIGTDLAKEVQEFYSRYWRATEPPSFLHPDREVLWRIDGALAAMAEFEGGPEFHPILRGPVHLLRNELQASFRYLTRRDHTVAWVGDIGVGKTTALAHAVGLLIGDGRGQRRPAFPTGAGRTTLCETEIRVSPTYGVAIEAIADEELIKLARDLVSSLAPDAAGVGVPAELDRALRNLAGMKKLRVQISDDEFQVADPIADLLSSGLTIDQAVDQVVAAMRLSERKLRQALLPEGSLDGMNWLSSLVAKINNGQEPRFGVPNRITVMIPSANLSAEGQVLSVLDTRGVEGSTQRRDLTDLRDDVRTLVVLCAKFADAPGGTATRFLDDARNAGSDAAQQNRLCILVLPRGDEALQLPGLDEPVTSRAEGYAIRRQEINQALVQANAGGLPTYFFDALTDSSEKIWRELRGQVGAMRKAYADRALEAAEGVANLINNVDLVRTTEARRKMETDADLLLGQIQSLPPTIKPAYLNLLDQIEATHPSSIAASISRQGEWRSFDIANLLGVGVRIDINRRTKSHLDRVEFKLQEFEKEHGELRDVVESVKGLRAGIAEGRQELLSTAKIIGQDAYGTLIGRAREVWKKSEKRYGGGPGYKNSIAGYWREFFESGDESQVEAAKAIDDRLQNAWEKTVLTRIQRGTRAQTTD